MRAVVDWRQGTMTEWQYTDIENTGAPVVPLLSESDVTIDGGDVDGRRYEIRWSEHVD